MMIGETRRHTFSMKFFITNDNSKYDIEICSNKRILQLMIGQAKRHVHNNVYIFKIMPEESYQSNMLVVS